MKDFTLGFLVAATLFCSATIGFVFFCPVAKKMFQEEQPHPLQNIMLMIPQMLGEPEQVAPKG